jgi:hypothetical protein
MPGFFTYTPERFFQRLVRDFSALCSSPSEDGVISVVFPLFHLREWLCPGREGELLKHIRQTAATDRTPAECLYLALEGLSEYALVKALCNHAKHFEYGKDPLDCRMNQLQGARAGMMRAGDSIDVTHFTVDGIDIRSIFWPIYQIYFDYFERHSPGIAAAAEKLD